MKKFKSFLAVVMLFVAILITQAQPFIENPGIIPNFPGLSSGELMWADFDGDGYLDILITGISDDNPFTEIYKNNPGEAFSSFNSGLIPLSNSNVSLCDFDNDSDMDIFICGLPDESISQNPISRLYKNEGGGTTLPEQHRKIKSQWCGVNQIIGINLCCGNGD